MDINLTTPALLFPAISLLLLAYTNRFLAIATLIRSLHQKHLNSPDHPTPIIGQIENLKARLSLIKLMQIFGVFSFFLCVLSMLMLFQNATQAGNYIFGTSMVFLLISLGISLRELQISTKALNLELSDMELKRKL
ncbi:DUF2721 domain-containing protein [Fulvivirga sp.]|jgi:hypothetical protein|uniref:DUF2721 domain-containing protein n=1 Tax=Fulvivirga sp. TaxID=1931237 RepID=UPI0032EFDD60